MSENKPPKPPKIVLKTTSSPKKSPFRLKTGSENKGKENPKPTLKLKTSTPKKKVEEEEVGNMADLPDLPPPPTISASAPVLSDSSQDIEPLNEAVEEEALPEVAPPQMEEIEPEPLPEAPQEFSAEEVQAEEPVIEAPPASPEFIEEPQVQEPEPPQFSSEEEVQAEEPVVEAPPVAPPVAPPTAPPTAPPPPPTIKLKTAGPSMAALKPQTSAPPPPLATGTGDSAEKKAGPPLVTPAAKGTAPLPQATVKLKGATPTQPLIAAKTAPLQSSIQTGMTSEPDEEEESAAGPVLALVACAISVGVILVQIMNLNAWDGLGSILGS